MIIPFHRLAYSFLLRSGEGGFRKDLQESIADKGILIPLTVMPFRSIYGQDRYMVLDGQARMRALAVLVKQNKITPKYSVPCDVIEPTHAQFDAFCIQRGVSAPRMEAFLKTTSGRGLLKTWEKKKTGTPDAIAADYSAVEFKVAKAIHEGAFYNGALGVPYKTPPTFVGSPNHLRLCGENHEQFTVDINSVETHLQSNTFRFDTVCGQPRHELPEWLKDYCLSTPSDIMVKIRSGPYEFNLKLNGKLPRRENGGWVVELQKPITANATLHYDESGPLKVRLPQPITVCDGQHIAVDYETAWGRIRRGVGTVADLAVVKARGPAISKSFDLGTQW